MDSVLWLFLNMLWTVSSGYFGCAVDIVLWLLWICCGQCLLALLDMLWTVSSGYFGYAVDSVLWLFWICCGQCPLAILDMLWTVSSPSCIYNESCAM